MTGMSPQLQVRDLARSLAWYRDVLGFEVEFEYEGFYAAVRRDGHTIHLKCGDPEPEVRARRRAADDLDIAFTVDDVDGLFAEVLSRGAEVVQPVRQMPYGREFCVADSDGYLLGFMTPAAP